MENESKALTQASPLINGALSRRRSATAEPPAGRSAVRRWRERQVEWAILRTSSVNGLIVGVPHLTAVAVALLDRSLRQPVVAWAPDQTPDIPELTAGTLLIHDVDRLDARQQERLSRWIGVHCPAVRVLALARSPLFAQVVDGRFSAALYYGLNTVMVEVRTPADMP
jgi:hypothetical protein